MYKGQSSRGPLLPPNTNKQAASSSAGQSNHEAKSSGDHANANLISKSKPVTRSAAAAAAASTASTSTSTAAQKEPIKPKQLPKEQTEPKAAPSSSAAVPGTSSGSSSR